MSKFVWDDYPSLIWEATTKLAVYYLIWKEISSRTQYSLTNH